MAYPIPASGILLAMGLELLLLLLVSPFAGSGVALILAAGLLGVITLFLIRNLPFIIAEILGLFLMFGLWSLLAFFRLVHG